MGIQELRSERFQLKERQTEILERLESAGRVQVSELAKTLSVSDVTVRKDLQELERLSLLKRVHGGAVTAHRSKYNLSLGDKLGRLGVEKLAIATAALEVIHEGDTIILDAGSTTLALARLLPGNFGGLTVVTNSLPVIAELSRYDDFEVISLGGMVRSHSLAMIGPLAVASLAKLHADLAFLAATGASIEHGLSTPNIIEAETKSAMTSAASRVVALVDHSKIGQASLAPYAGWEQVSTLISDQALPDPLAAHLASSGVEVAVACRRRGM